MAKVGGYWQETYLVTLSVKGGSDYEFAAKCEDVTFGGGARGITLKTLVNGGNLVQFNPQEMWTVTMTLYPVEVSDIEQMFYGGTLGGAQPRSATNVFNRYEMRFALLFTDDTGVTSGVGAVDATYAAYRIYATGGYITNAMVDPSGKELKVEVTVEFAPFDATLTNGTDGVLHKQSTDGTALAPPDDAYSLVALGSYT
jgi:hypothetical protein